MTSRRRRAGKLTPGIPDGTGPASGGPPMSGRRRGPCVEPEEDVDLAELEYPEEDIEVAVAKRLVALAEELSGGASRQAGQRRRAGARAQVKGDVAQVLAQAVQNAVSKELRRPIAADDIEVSQVSEQRGVLSVWVSTHDDPVENELVVDLKAMQVY